MILLCVKRESHRANIGNIRAAVGAARGYELSVSNCHDTMRGLVANGYLDAHRKEGFDGRPRLYYSLTRKSEHLIETVKGLMP